MRQKSHFFFFFFFLPPLSHFYLYTDIYILFFTFLDMYTMLLLGWEGILCISCQLLFAPFVSSFKVLP